MVYALGNLYKNQPGIHSIQNIFKINKNCFDFFEKVCYTNFAVVKRERRIPDSSLGFLIKMRWPDMPG